MHADFANWYQPVTFGHDREVLELRWKGIDEALDGIENEMVQELVRLVYGKQPISSKLLDDFRQFFRNVDPTFLTKGNDHEIHVLAGCVLAVLLLEFDYPEVAQAILTTSVCDIRKLSGKIDLVGMAKEKILKDGISARKRPLMFAPKQITPDESIVFDNLENLGTTTIKALNGVQKNIHHEINLLQKIIEIQDEELQLLWWMIGNRSTMWDISFNEITEESRPVLLAIEAASMISALIESPSLKAVFSRVGLSSTMKVNIPDAISSCGTERLEKIAPDNQIDPLIFPVHFAMTRALETGADKTWIPGWSKISGIGKNTQLTQLQLALQVYRERNLISQLKIS